MRSNRPYLILAVSSPHLVADLARYGIVDAKSHIFAWPEALPVEYVRPFILGYFDGDGHITSDVRILKDGKVHRYNYIGFTKGERGCPCF